MRQENITKSLVGTPRKMRSLLWRKEKRRVSRRSADLSHPEANLLDQITQWVLWRVAQSQYDQPQVFFAST
jgi:hypothetical protein